MLVVELIQHLMLVDPRLEVRILDKEEDVELPLDEVVELDDDKTLWLVIENRDMDDDDEEEVKFEKLPPETIAALHLMAVKAANEKLPVEKVKPVRGEPA